MVNTKPTSLLVEYHALTLRVLQYTVDHYKTQSTVRIALLRCNFITWEGEEHMQHETLNVPLPLAPTEY